MGWQPQPRFCRRRRRWYVQLRGKQYTLGTDQASAHEKFARLYRELYGEPTLRRPAGLAEVVGLWLDQQPSKWHRYVTGDFAAFVVGIPTAGEIPRTLLEDFVGHLREKGNAQQTIRHKTQYAVRVLRWALDREWIAKLPRVPRLAKPPVGHRDIAAHLLPAMLADMTDKRRLRTGCIVRFCLATGCRPGEARKLRWSDIDMDAREIRLAKHKTAHRTGRERVIYLGDEALDLLREVGKMVRHQTVFVNNRGKPWSKDGLGRNLRRWFGVSPNQLRHTWAQSALDQTSREDVAKLLGHTGTGVVDVYCQIRDRRAHEVARSLKSPMSLPPP